MGSHRSLSPSISPVSLDESESTYTEHLVKTKFKEVTYQNKKTRNRGRNEEASEGGDRRAEPPTVCGGRRQDVAPVWRHCLQEEPSGQPPVWSQCVQAPLGHRQGTFLQTSPRFLRPPSGQTTKEHSHHHSKFHQDPPKRGTCPVYRPPGDLKAYPEDSHVISSIVKKVGGPHVTYRRRSGPSLDDDTTPRRECLDASVNTDPFVHRVNASMVNIVSDADKVPQKVAFEPFCRPYQIQELPQLNIRPRLVKQSGPIIDIKEEKPPSPKNNIAIVEFTHPDPNLYNTSNLQDQHYGIHQKTDPTNDKELKLMKITKEFYQKLKFKEGLNVDLMSQKLEILISHLKKLNPSQMANYKFANMDLMSANESIDTLFANMDLVTEILLNEMKKIQTLGRYCSIHSSIVKAVDLLCQNITSIFAFDEPAKMAKNLIGPPQSDTSTKGEVKTKLRRQKISTKEQRKIVKNDSKECVKHPVKMSVGGAEQDTSTSTVRDVIIPATTYIPYRQLVPGGRFACVEEAEEPGEKELRSRRLARIYQIRQTLRQQIRPSQEDSISSPSEGTKSLAAGPEGVKPSRDHVLNQTFVIDNGSDVDERNNEEKSKPRNSTVQNIEASPKDSGTTVFYEDDWEKDDSGETTKDESNRNSTEDKKVAKDPSEESVPLNKSMSTSEETPSRPEQENSNSKNETKKSLIVSTKSVQTEELCRNVSENIDRHTIFDPCCHLYDLYSPRSFIVEKIIHKENVILMNREIQTEETMSNLANIHKVQPITSSNNEQTTTINKAKEQDVNNYEQRTTTKDGEKLAAYAEESIAAKETEQVVANEESAIEAEREEQDLNHMKHSAASTNVIINERDTVNNAREEQKVNYNNHSTTVQKAEEINVQKNNESSLKVSQFQLQPLPVLRLTNAKTNSLLEVRFPDQSEKFEGSLTVQTSEKSEEIKLLYNTKDEATMRLAQCDKMHSVVEHLPQATTVCQIPIVKDDVGMAASEQGAGEMASTQQTNVQNFESITTNFVDFLETKVTEMVNKFRMSDINQRKTILAHDKVGVSHCATNLNTHESIKKSLSSLLSDRSNEEVGLRQLMSSRGSTPAAEREHFPNLTSPNIGLVLKKDQVVKLQESLEEMSQVHPVYSLKVQGESSNTGDNKTENRKPSDVLVHLDQLEIDTRPLMEENLKAPETLTLNKTEVKKSVDRLLPLPFDVLDKNNDVTESNNGQATGSVDLCEESTMPLWRESDEDMVTLTMQQVEEADGKMRQDCNLLPLASAIEPLAFQSDNHSEAVEANVDTQVFFPVSVDVPQELPQFLSPYPGSISRDTAVQAKISSTDVHIQTNDKQDCFQVSTTQNFESTKSESTAEAKESTFEVSVGSTTSSRHEDSSQILVKPFCSLQTSSGDAATPANESCFKMTETDENCDNANDWSPACSDPRRSESTVETGVPTGVVPLPADLPPGNDCPNHEELAEDSLPILDASLDSIQIRHYNSDDMSEGEVGFVYTYNSYSSGEVRLKVQSDESDEEEQRVMCSPEPDASCSGGLLKRPTAGECRVVGTREEVGSSSEESTSTGELRRMFTKEERLRSSTPLSNETVVSPVDSSSTV